MKKYASKLKPTIAAIMMASGALTASIPAFAVLEEIIVTANKRAESANDIGLSIAAISGEKLAEQKMTSLEEITSGIPGLVFATSQQNTPVLTMRGVGFNESSLGVYPAVSMYVDEVPLPFSAMGAHSAYDLERVEVLKGPQGVLFGQNSTGGAINFIAAKPTEELSYGGDISYGRFNKIETNAFVSGPLGENVGARLAIQNVTADDWQKSVTRGDENGEEDYTAARLSLNLQPNDSSDININLNGWRDKSNPQALQFIAASPKRFDQAPASAALIVAIPFADQSARSADWSSIGEPSTDKEFLQMSVRGDFELSESKTLTALVSYSDYEQDQRSDGDGTNLILADFEYNVGAIDSTFAEIRLAHEDGQSIRWVVGANYEKTSTEEDQLLRYLENTSYRPQTVFINGSGVTTDQEIESYAVFGNIDYDLTDALTLKVGARYTDTTIDAEICGYAPPNLPGVIDTSNGTGTNVGRLFGILGARSTRPFDTIQIGDCYTLDAPAGPGGGAAPAPENGIPGILFEDTLAEDNVSWRVGLDYQLNDVLFYANLSQGYKTGSYPALAGATFDATQPVTEESVLAYEAGFKASLAENTMQLNGAIFYYDYEDKQVRGKVPDAIFGPLDALVNIPESTITGIEADIVVQITDEFTVTAAATYLDSEVDKYVGYSVLGVNPSDPASNLSPEDLSGNSLPYTPELTYSLDLDYRKMLEGGGLLFMGLNVVGQSDSDAVFNGDDIALPADRIANGTAKSITDNYFVIESYHTVGARIGYETADERWKVMLWGKNITDEYYYNAVIASSENGARVAGRPATYGISVGYKL